MAIVRASEAPRYDLPGGTHFFGLLAPSRGSTELCTWRLELEPGVGDHNSPAHQLDHEEAFMVLEGELGIAIDGEWFTLQPGDAISVPARSPLQVINPGSEVTKVFVCIRSGFRAKMMDTGEEIMPPWAQ